jgi:hypothetical protein
MKRTSRFADRDGQSVQSGIRIKTDDLSEADRLNGIEWSGAAVIEAEAVRTLNLPKGWSDWTSGGGLFGGHYEMLIRFAKEKGRWAAEPNQMWPPPIAFDFPQNMCEYKPQSPTCDEWK